MSNPQFLVAWDNMLNFKPFNIDAIASENAEIAQDIEAKIKKNRKHFAALYSGVQRGTELLFNPCPIYPTVVHAIKQELGYQFCEDHPEEVAALFDALVNIAKAQEQDKFKS